MTKIKLNNVEVDKAELVKLYKERPELFKDEEKPLGDDFSMLEYFRELRNGVESNYIINNTHWWCSTQARDKIFLPNG